jgi:hypothetical protein
MLQRTRRLIGLKLMNGKGQGFEGRPLDFEPLAAFLTVAELRARKGVFGVEEFLICRNRECRFLISLRDGNKLVRRADLILSACPECDHEWSGRCPFCLQILMVTWQNKIPCCSHCRRSLQPEAHLE